MLESGFDCLTGAYFVIRSGIVFMVIEVLLNMISINLLMLLGLLFRKP